MTNDTLLMRLVPREDRPSILVDEISGLEFTEYVRDVQPPHVQFSCEKFGKIICMCRATRLGLIKKPHGPVLKFVGSIPKTRAYFDACMKSFTPAERAEIG